MSNYTNDTVTRSTTNNTRTLDGTIFSWVYDLAWSNSDKDLFDKISIAMAVFVLGSIVLNFIKPVRYGKTARNVTKGPISYLNYNLNSRFVWRVGVEL